MTPVLSIVATSRNDDHGGNLNDRMQWFVDGLLWHATRRKVVLELVLVEWNPPEDRPPLVEILRWPAETDWLKVRISTVPPSIHRNLVQGSTMPMLQMIAKNVGIRRASAEAVLATNIDVLLTDELFSASVAGIGEGAVWRADRYDVEFPFPPLADVGAALDFSRHHPIRYERRDGVYYPEAGRVLPIYQSIGDFASYQLHRGTGAIATRLGVRGGRSARPHPRIESGRPRAAVSIARWGLDRGGALFDLAVLPKLHVNACGDFTLLAKKDWESLRGYPEWVVHSWHLDTIFLHQAAGSRMRFVELGASVRRIPHGACAGFWVDSRGPLPAHEHCPAKRDADLDVR